MLLTLVLAATAATSSPTMPGWEVDADSLAAQHAPVFVQEANWQGDNRTQDLPVAFDFDGDWDMRNNWKTQPAGTREAEPVVHYAVMATGRRAYISYYLFYPRDWSRFCLPKICHENDLEQLTVVVERDGSKFGRALLMDVKFHRGQSAYPVEGSGAKPREATKSRLTLNDAGRPLARIEWGGHGVTSCDMDGNGINDRACLVAPTNHSYVLHPKGTEPHRLPGGDPARAYSLVRLKDSLWAHRDVGAEGTWDRSPLKFVGRRLGRLGGALGRAFAGSEGGARAPWGIRSAEGAGDGERFFDPALAIAERWDLSGGLDPLPYVEHGFAEELRAECSGAACDAEPMAFTR